MVFKLLSVPFKVNMGIDLSHANIGQVNVASENSTMNIYNSEKIAELFFEANKASFDKAVTDVEESIKELPTETQETISKEIENLKGEVVKTNPDGNLVKTSISVLDNIVNTISNAPNAVKTIARLIMIAKTFFGL